MVEDDVNQDSPVGPERAYRGSTGPRSLALSVRKLTDRAVSAGQDGLLGPHLENVRLKMADASRLGTAGELGLGRRSMEHCLREIDVSRLNGSTSTIRTWQASWSWAAVSFLGSR